MRTKLQADPPRRAGDVWIIALSEQRLLPMVGWAWFEKVPHAVVLVRAEGVDCLGVDGRAVELASAYERVPGLLKMVQQLQATGCVRHLGG